MKRSTAPRLFAVCLAALLSLTARSGAADGSVITKPVDLVFSSQMVGTSAYTVCIGIGTVLQENLPAGSLVDVQPISPGGFGAAYSFEETAASRADITISSCGTVRVARDEGTLGFPPATNIVTLVGALNTQHLLMPLQISFIKKHNVASLEDALRRKLPIRIGCAAAGSTDEFFLLRLFQFLGITYSDLKGWGGDIVWGDATQVSAMMRDGMIDMVFDQTNKDAAGMNEIDLTCEVQFMQLTEEMTKKFSEVLGTETNILPAGTWKNQKEDLQTVGWPDGLFCRADLDDDTAYTLAKIIVENAKRLSAELASLGRLSPEECWRPEAMANVPLHPGAEKYFRDAGLKK